MWHWKNKFLPLMTRVKLRAQELMKDKEYMAKQKEELAKSPQLIEYILNIPQLAKQENIDERNKKRTRT